MSKYKICCFLFLLLFQQTFAQNAPIKLGEVNEKDVKATQYDKFPDAEAIVLCDYGNVYYNFCHC